MPPMAMEIRKVTAADLVRRVAAIARQGEHGPRALFTILAGAGISLGAGMPSTAMLVAAMKARKSALAVGGTLASWAELLTSAESAESAGTGTALAGTTAEYQALFNDDEIFPSPLHRQRFISDAIVWASSRRAALSPESTRLASILLAGAGRRTESGTSPSMQKAPQLGRWLAHTLYTTNFDEVIPQALRYCGEPVIVVDHPGAHGRLQGEPSYPRVAYLHGCHLHYSLRNTAAELGRADADRTGGVDIAGLFLRFRDVLRSTGLIVLGYSGWNDRAVRAIQDALADEESLPYGVYWGARFGEKSLSDTALQLLRQHPDRAFMLDENKDAATTLDTLCVGLGVPYQLDMDRWRSRFSGVHTHFDVLAQALQPVAAASPATAPAAEAVAKQSATMQRELEQSKLLKEALAIDAEFDGNQAHAWLARLDELVARELSGPGDLSPDLLWFSGHFRSLTLDTERALRDLHAAYQRFEADGAEQKAAGVQMEIASTLVYMDRYADAEKAAIDAAARLRKLGDAESYVVAMSWASASARARGLLDRAEQLASEARAEVERAAPNGRSFYYENLSKVLIRRGKLTEAAAAADLSLKNADGRIRRTISLNLLGTLALYRNDLDAATKHFAEARSLIANDDPSTSGFRTDVGLAEAALRAGRYQEALDLLKPVALFDRERRPLPYDIGLTVEALQAQAEQKLGVPGPYAKRAEDGLERLEQRGKNKIAIFELRLLWARVLAEAGRPERALELALAVRDEAKQIGEALIEENAEKLMAELRAPQPQTPSPTGPPPAPRPSTTGAPRGARQIE